MAAKKDRQEEQAPPEEQVEVDPALAALQGMMTFEDRRYLVQTVAVGKKDANGMRELTFPITPTRQITFILAPELQEHILKQFAGGIKIADLTDLAAAKELEEQKQKEGEKS